MANASFHAKITADARQFIQQVEQANQALQELTREQKKQTGATGGGGASNQKKTQQESQDALKKEHALRQRLDAEQREAARAVVREKREQADVEREISKQNRIQNDAMVTGRYALYDMANAYRGIAESAVRIAQKTMEAVGAFGQFETAFTAVERAATLDVGTDQFLEMREALIDLSTEIPVAFSQISEIATLGAQMGVATGDLTQFTETIAKFSAVTGNSIDNTAEKFGRLSALANVPTEEFENLASSVVFAGFNAVATEKEILKMSESIVAAAANSGYAGDQVVGLATALSSLGVPPERARGAIQELFSEMNRSVEGTSDKITNFADLMGLTESSAKSLFKSDPEAFFTQFLGGLSGIENLTVKLDEFGFVNKRTVDVIQRLSGNMDVYQKSIREASEAYAEGTALAEVYGDTSDNLEAKVERLKNAFEGLQATAGEGFGEQLKPLVEFLVDATNAAREFAKSGIGQSIIPLVTTIAAVTAAFAGFRFVTSIATAQLLAMRVAILKMGQLGNMVAKPFANLTRAITGNLYVVNQAGMATQYLSKQQIAAQVSSGKLTAETQRQALAMGRASIATRALSIAMTGLGAAMIGAVVVGVGAMAYEMTRFNIDLTKTGANAAQLADAIHKDTKAFNEGGDAIATHTNKLNTNKNSSLNSREAANLVVDSQGKIAESFIDTTEKIEDNTIALGENYRQLMVNSLIESEAFQKFYDDAAEAGISVIEVTDQVGLSFEDLINAAAQEPGTGALDLLIDKAEEFGEANEGMLTDIKYDETASAADRVMAELASVLQNTTGDAATLRASVLSAIDVMSKEKGTSAFAGRLFKVAEALDRTTEKSLTLAELENLFNATGDGISDATDGMDDFTESATGASRALRTVLDYSNDLGGIFNRIMGIEFGELEAEDQIANGWEKIAEKAADAEEAMKDANLEIKELEADKGVLEYQLSVAERYGDEQRAAVIRAKLAKTNEKLADEEKKFNDAQTESEMGLEGNTSAARENRDALIGLVGEYGNLIQAAVDAGMEGEELEDYIRSLKEEFIEQGEEVGFSREELVKYSDIFDGFITTVEKVDPRVDIEFNSNISAAEQAFNEYMAKLRSANGYKTTQIVETKFEQKVPHKIALSPVIMGSDVRLFRIGLNSGSISLSDYYKAVYGIDYKTFQTISRNAGSSFQPQGLPSGYSTGGFVTGPGGSTSDSIPAMLSNGEYVIKASAVGAYGVDFMNALNQQRLPMRSMSSATNSSSQSQGSNIVYLSPQDRALLRQVADRPVNLYADNGKIAQSANAGNVTLSQRGLN